MARRPRHLLPERGPYHAFVRSVDGARIVRTRSDCLEFLKLFAQVVDRFAWHVHVFCLMTTHYHVVLEAPLAALSRGMHRLNGIYARTFNDRYGRHGHLFGDRFGARAVRDDEALREACRYVLANPVRAGVCERPQDWPWSGSRYGFDSW